VVIATQWQPVITLDLLLEFFFRFWENVYPTPKAKHWPKPTPISGGHINYGNKN